MWFILLITKKNVRWDTFSLHSPHKKTKNQKRFFHSVSYRRHQTILWLPSQSNFVQIKPIGKGGYGIVFKATLTKPPYSERVVKVINKKYIKNAEGLKKEVELLRKVDHPNIVKLYESYEDQNFLYLVLEYGLCDVVIGREVSYLIELIKTVRFLNNKLGSYLRKL